jgi:hypothetical protein
MPSRALILIASHCSSYNVLGHCKTCVIIVGGAMMFREVTQLAHAGALPLTPCSSPPRGLQAFDVRKSCGVICCILGAFWYARMKQQAPPIAVATQGDGGDAAAAVGVGVGAKTT